MNKPPELVDTVRALWRAEQDEGILLPEPVDEDRVDSGIRLEEIGLWAQKFLKIRTKLGSMKSVDFFISALTFPCLSMCVCVCVCGGGVLKGERLHSMGMTKA